jgi:hypothetical protein
LILSPLRGDSGQACEERGNLLARDSLRLLGLLRTELKLRPYVGRRRRTELKVRARRAGEARR